MSDDAETTQKLIAYRIDRAAPDIRPAPSRREWMDQTPDRFAYRCLPMVIANMSGWDILCPATFAASWNGRLTREAISVTFHEAPSEFVQSHFGVGVLTFHVGYIFRTPPGYNLWVKGPANAPRNGIVPLEGVVETDWTVTPFTMNWRFVRPGAAVLFKKGEPICTVVPIPRGLLESFEPEIRDLHDESELNTDYQKWRGRRRDFISGLRQEGDTPAKQAKWQRDYFQGDMPEGGRFEGHQTKLGLKPFQLVDDETDS